jgi:hypothetical protein
MISAKLEAALLDRKNKNRGLEDRLEAYHIWGTIGTDLFLTREGKLLRFVAGDSLDEDTGSVEELTKDIEINAALTAAKFNVPGLAEVLPDPPTTSVDCPECHGVGRRGLFVICKTCNSLGWVAAGTKSGEE